MGEATREDVNQLRKDQKSESEVGQALFEEIQAMKGQLIQSQSMIQALMGRVQSVQIRTTDNGESGLTRTFEMPGLSKNNAIMAISCGQGAVPAMVVSATCLVAGEATISFDVDPSTDHKVSIWVSAPDKILL